MGQRARFSAANDTSHSVNDGVVKLTEITDHKRNIMPPPVKSADAGLWKRGMLLFVLIAVIAGVALFVALWRPRTNTTSEALHPDLVVAAMSAQPAPAPAHVNWGALYRLSREFPSPKGWEIRYNATLTLARNGSEHVNLSTLREILDERRQIVNFQTRNKDGKLVKNETKAYLTVLNGLRAFVKWRQHLKIAKKFGPDNADLTIVRNTIDRLTRSKNKELAAEARDALAKLAK